LRGEVDNILLYFRGEVEVDHAKFSSFGLPAPKSFHATWALMHV